MKKLTYFLVSSLFLISCGKTSSELNKEAEAFEAKNLVKNLVTVTK